MAFFNSLQPLFIAAQAPANPFAVRPANATNCIIQIFAYFGRADLIVLSMMSEPN